MRIRLREGGRVQWFKCLQFRCTARINRQVELRTDARSGRQLDVYFHELAQALHDCQPEAMPAGRRCFRVANLLILNEYLFYLIGGNSTACIRYQQRQPLVLWPDRDHY